MGLLQETHQQLQQGRINLLELSTARTPKELRDMYPDKKLCVCDFYVKGSEKGNIREYGIEHEGILIIDHHSRIEEMKKDVSSAVLAKNYAEAKEEPPKDHTILINHTDCDSMLSMLIMAGLLPPEQRYAQAAIAADHTGQENTIADLLQAIQKKRDVLFSTENLEALLEGKNLTPEAEHMLEERREERKIVKELAENGSFSRYNSIAYAILDRKIDTALLPSQLHDAKVIMTASPMPPGSKERWEIKTRLGKGVGGIYLNELGLPDWGGRWNAGSTKRHGGTGIEPEEYVRILHKKMDNP